MLVLLMSSLNVDGMSFALLQSCLELADSKLRQQVTAAEKSTQISL